MTLLEQLLAPLSLADFLRDYFLQRPYARRGAEALRHLDRNWARSLVANPDADVLAVRAGTSTRPEGKTLEEWLAEGATLRVRHAEKHDAELQRLADEFRATFRSPVDVHVYCTPAGQRGLDWHYDAEDVFVLQTQGQKTWLLRKNTVNPWPLAETMPADLRVEREFMPATGCTLDTGDWLYVPNGYWHRTEAQGESISLAIGVSSRTAIDAFDFLRTRLVEDLRWRQRLPLGDAAPSEQVFADLARDLAAAFAKPEFRRAFWERAAGSLLD